ncbi:hypothetical protein SDC9_177483 [bioreactor metagenome]|uniref:Uncharacterized protein n=1 Tax=bioreactor metagenome TaxID=1076179 RepID=A0A645GUU9_9ZZZZ
MDIGSDTAPHKKAPATKTAKPKRLVTAPMTDGRTYRSVAVVHVSSPVFRASENVYGTRHQSITTLQARRSPEKPGAKKRTTSRPRKVSRRQTRQPNATIITLMHPMRSRPRSGSLCSALTSVGRTAFSSAPDTVPTKKPTSPSAMLYASIDAEAPKSHAIMMVLM